MNFCMVAKFFERNFFDPKISWKEGFVLVSYFFFQNFIYNEILYFLLYSCANPIFGENLVLEIWVKVLQANHIARFLDQLGH